MNNDNKDRQFETKWYCQDWQAWNWALMRSSVGIRPCTIIQQDMERSKIVAEQRQASASKKLSKQQVRSATITTIWVADWQSQLELNRHGKKQSIERIEARVGEQQSDMQSTGSARACCSLRVVVAQLRPPLLLLLLLRLMAASIQGRTLRGALRRGGAGDAANIQSKQRADNNSLSELSLSLAAYLLASLHKLQAYAAIAAAAVCAAPSPHAYKAQCCWESFFVLPSTRFDTTTKHSPTLPFYSVGATSVTSLEAPAAFSESLNEDVPYYKTIPQRKNQQT